MIIVIINRLIRIPFVITPPAGNGHTQAMKWLIENGANLSIRMHNGDTALARGMNNSLRFAESFHYKETFRVWMIHPKRSKKVSLFRSQKDMHV